MIKQIKQICRLLRHKKGTQIPWITQIWSQEWLLGAFIAAQEPLARRSQIYQNLLKNLGAIMQIIQDKSQKTQDFVFYKR